MKIPSVSICIPAYQSAESISGAIDSALEQTHLDFELVVIDDASTDNTAEVVRRYTDPRIRFSVNARNLGMAGNWNETARQARAPLVKFLHDDDRIEPSCLAELVPLFEHRSVAIAFSRRRVELEDPEDPLAMAWMRDNEVVHARLGVVSGPNNGTELFERYLAAGFPANWVGEPSCVMVRKECLRRVGGFSLRVRQILDVDLWIRLMAHYEVGFVDAELSVYRFGQGSTMEIVGSEQHWLDRLWMLHGLRRFPHLDHRYPQLLRLEMAERRLALRRLAGDVASGTLPVRRLRDMSAYALSRAQGTVGRAPASWGEIA